MALLVLTELLTAIRAKDAQGFREWLGTAFDIFGLSAVEELFREYLLPLLSDEECDRIAGGRIGRQPLKPVIAVLLDPCDNIADTLKQVT